MNHEVFEDWFTSQPLPDKTPSSIIVMDNAPYHSVQVDKPPTMVSNTAVIIEFM